jgi:hypothetical protein
MCAAEIAQEHGHVADLQNSSLICACRACYLLFTRPDAGRYRSIPDRYLTDPAHPITGQEWESLEIPVGLAFFLRDSRAGTTTAFYPSPAGATECQLDLQAWDELAAAHPLLRAATPDVEAVLMSRTEPANPIVGPAVGIQHQRRADDGPREQARGVESFVVPIDACYELAGRMRLHWRGFDGGSEAKASLEAILDQVRGRARDLEYG